VSVMQETIVWLTDAANYEGQGSIPQRIAEHLDFTFRAIGLAALVAIPAGYFIGHTGRGKVWVVGVTGAARALPTFGLMLYLVLVLGVTQRVWAALIGLIILAIPPLLAGAYAGIGQIDPTAIDAARAQGMTEWQILFRVEIPLSLPLVVGGLRGAVLQVVATVTLIAYVGLGGLGFDLIQGIPLRRFDQVVGSAVLIVFLALLLDGLLAALARFATPRGVRQGRVSDVRARTASSRLASTGPIPVSHQENRHEKVKK
jgi:osmoprotectant transport system permease protein